MAEASALIVPLLIAGIFLFGLLRRVDVFDAFVQGAKDGLKVVGKILPNLVLLLTCIHMLRASGALDALTALIAPLLRYAGIPPETAPLMLLRPVSGSGALAVGADMMERYGVNSLIGRITAVMLGSTETTFYVVTVYFGSAGIRKTRYAIPAAMIADITGFLLSSVTVRLLF